MDPGRESTWITALHTRQTPKGRLWLHTEPSKMLESTRGASWVPDTSDVLYTRRPPAATEVPHRTNSAQGWIARAARWLPDT
jgi:hypothetical protein